jgi:hypothetical protein
MKRTSLVALAFAAVLAVTSIGAAHAAPVAAPPCYNTDTATHDMAGAYFAPELPAAIEVNACGGVEITWDNSTGRHIARFGATERLRGGGFIARATEAIDDIYPNGAKVIGIKPAERGTIQMITTDSAGDITGVYKLTKVR